MFIKLSNIINLNIIANKPTSPLFNNQLSCNRLLANKIYLIKGINGNIYIAFLKLGLFSHNLSNPYKLRPNIDCKGTKLDCAAGFFKKDDHITR